MPGPGLRIFEMLLPDIDRSTAQGSSGTSWRWSGRRKNWTTNWPPREDVVELCTRTLIDLVGRQVASAG